MKKYKPRLIKHTYLSSKNSAETCPKHALNIDSCMLVCRYIHLYESDHTILCRFLFYIHPLKKLEGVLTTPEESQRLSDEVGRASEEAGKL